MPATCSTSAASCSTTSPSRSRHPGARRRRLHLSHREPLNRYTFVDIDPAIRAIAEREFLREAARRRVHRHRCATLRRRYGKTLRRAGGRCLQRAHVDSRPSGDARVLERHAARAEAGRGHAGQPDPRRPACQPLRPQPAGNHRKRLWPLRRGSALQVRTAQQRHRHLLRRRRMRSRPGSMSTNATVPIIDSARSP
jgi:hypothetical protein